MVPDVYLIPSLVQDGLPDLLINFFLPSCPCVPYDLPVQRPRYSQVSKRHSIHVNDEDL